MAALKYIEGCDVDARRVKQALALDNAVYPEEYHLSEQVCLDYLDKNNQIYFMAVDTQNDVVVGYVNLSPITSAAYTTLISGEVNDTVLTKDSIETYRSGEQYALYFSSVIVGAEYRGKGIATTLLLTATEKIKTLFFDGIIVNTLVADAISAQGENFCKKLGMKFLKATQHTSKLYLRKLFTPKTTAKQVIQTVSKMTHGLRRKKSKRK